LGDSNVTKFLPMLWKQNTYQ